MTSTQLVISIIAITIAVVNPWLVALSNRKAAARAAKAAPVKKEERIMAPADIYGWLTDLGVFLFAFTRVLGFVRSQEPMTRLDVALVAVFAAVMFSVFRNVAARITLVLSRIDRRRSSNAA